MAKRSKKPGLQKADDLRMQAERFFDGGNYAGAIQAWEKLGRRTPTKVSAPALAEAHFRAGLQTLYQQGTDADPESAVAHLRRAVELQPAEARYYYHLGLAAQRQGDLATAIVHYRRARLTPGEFADRAAYPLALALLVQGEDPVTDPVWASLGAEEQELLLNAGAFGRRPYILSPNAPAPLKALAALDEGEVDAARRLLRQVVVEASSSPEVGLAHYYLGVIAAREEDWGGALDEWRAAQASGFESPGAAANLSELLYRFAEQAVRDGDLSGALAMAEETARYAPSGLPIQKLLVYLYQLQGFEAATSSQWQQAQQYLEQAHAAGGGDFRLAYNRAVVYEQLREFHRAGDAWREVLRRRPRRADHPDALTEEQVSRLWRRAADAYRQAGDFDDALAVYRTAVKWDPDNIETRLLLAEGLGHAGRLQAAENELRRILTQSPDSIPALLLLAELLAETGNWWRGNEATRHWSRVLELDPENEVARQSLVDFYLDQAEWMRSWAPLSQVIDTAMNAYEVDPGNPWVLALLGGYYLQAANSDLGQAFLEQAFERAGDAWETLALICEIWLAEVSEEAFWAILRRIEARAGDSTPYSFYLQLAHAASLSDEIAVMTGLWERAIRTAPAGTPILTTIGNMLLARQEASLAAEYFLRAIEVGEPPLQAYMQLTIAALLNGETENAQRYVRQAQAVYTADYFVTPQMLDELEELTHLPPAVALMLLVPAVSAGHGPSGFPGGPFDDYDEEDDEFD